MCREKIETSYQFVLKVKTPCMIIFKFHNIAFNLNVYLNSHVK